MMNANGNYSLELKCENSISTHQIGISLKGNGNGNAIAHFTHLNKNYSLELVVLACMEIH